MPKIKPLLEPLSTFIIAVAIFNIARVIPAGMPIPAGSFPVSYFSTLVSILILIILRNQSTGFLRKLPGDQGAESRLFMMAVLPTLMIKAALFFLDWQRLIGSLAVSLIILIATWIVASASKDPGERHTTHLALLPLLFTQLSPGFSNPSSAWSPGVYRFFYVGLVAFTEELLFRGVLFSQLESRFNRQWKIFDLNISVALLTSSTLFGLWHIINGFLLGGGFLECLGWGLWTFFLGIFLGLLRVKSKRILLPGIMHWIINI